MKEALDNITKDDIITQEYLDSVGFTRDKIICGYPVWRIENDIFNIAVAPWTDGGRTFISLYDKQNDKTWTFERGYRGEITRLTKNDLKQLFAVADIDFKF